VYSAVEIMDRSKSERKRPIDILTSLVWRHRIIAWKTYPKMMMKNLQVGSTSGDLCSGDVLMLISGVETSFSTTTPFLPLDIISISICCGSIW
jgi:hypothetical protein